MRVDKLRRKKHILFLNDPLKLWKKIIHFLITEVCLHFNYAFFVSFFKEKYNDRFSSSKVVCTYIFFLNDPLRLLWKKIIHLLITEVCLHFNYAFFVSYFQEKYNDRFSSSKVVCTYILFLNDPLRLLWKKLYIFSLREDVSKLYRLFFIQIEDIISNESNV